MNGVALTQDQLHKTKRIAVVSIAADSVTYYQQLPRVVKNSTNVASWQLDRYYAGRFSEGISKALNIQTISYNGGRRDELNKVYASGAMLKAERFNWRAIKDVVKGIADETGSDLVVLLLKDEFQDPTARFPFLVNGLGLSGNKTLCVAFAHLTLVAFDPDRESPVAGANVYIADVQGRALPSSLRAPEAACNADSEHLSAALQEQLRETYEKILSDRIVRETSTRLVRF